MLLSCPNCGTVNKIADVLIPSARLTATCSRCGGKIGGTVPSRLDGGRPGTKREGDKPKTAANEAASGVERPPGGTGGDAAAPGTGDGGDRGRQSLGAVSKGLDPERLAGLVASDMLLYNRDKIQKNAAGGRLLSSMATEIVEAWEFYKKRVGSHTALGTSYFRDALNNVLSDGDPII
jgi:hypothetical protein